MRIRLTGHKVKKAHRKIPGAWKSIDVRLVHQANHHYKKVYILELHDLDTAEMADF